MTGPLVASFKKALFRSRSEKIGPAQYELEIEDIETAIAQVGAEIDADERTAPFRPPKARQTNRGSAIISALNSERQTPPRYQTPQHR